MICTEEEAKTKWCPFVRAPAWIGMDDPENAIAVNRGVPGEHNCIGSACMAWRTVTVNELSEVVFAGTREGKSGTGFCGLAGGQQ